MKDNNAMTLICCGFLVDQYILNPTKRINIETPTFIFLVSAALMNFQGDLHNDVIENVNTENPCGPPWYMSLTKVHSNKHIRDCKVK